MRAKRIFALGGVALAALAVFASPATAEDQYGDYPAFVAGHSLVSGRGISHGTPLAPDLSVADPTTVTPENNCDRSWESGYVQAPLSLGMPVDFWACAGAIPQNVLDTPQFNEGSQLDHLGPWHRVVIMSNMGNPQLGLVSDCLQQPGSCNLVPGSQDLTRILESFSPYAAVDAQIHVEVRRKAAPDVRVFVVALPPALPSPTDDLSGCAGLLTPDNIAAMQIVLDRANQIMEANARAAGAVFVPLDREGSRWMEHDSNGNGHGVCSPNSWVWGLDAALPQDPRLWTSFKEWFRRILHPGAAAHDATREEIELTLRASLPGR